VASSPNPYLYVLDEPLLLSQVVARLAAMPTVLRETVAAIPPDELTRAPARDEWSAFQTLCHVRDATLTYAARFRWIVFNNDPLMPDYDENNWVAACKDTPADIADILDQVAASRADLTRMLSRLEPEQWERTGRHEAAGPIVLEHYARHQVVHERMHLEQLFAAARGQVRGLNASPKTSL
jgi:hypothetical protein